MPPEFTLTSDPIDDTRQVVAVAGEIDLFTAPELKAALGEALESGRIRIVVDLTETTFLDSTALGVLIEARSKLPNRGGFLLAAPGLETRRALQISGLDRHFGVHQTVGEALAATV